MVHTIKYKKKVGLGILLTMFALESTGATATTSVATAKGVSTVKGFNKKDAKKNDPKKAVSKSNGFFGYNSEENGDVVFNLFSDSLDANIIKTESSIKRSGLLRDLIEKVVRLNFELSQDLYPLNTADGNKPLSSKNDLIGSASFSINIDPGQHVLGIPAYMLGIRANKLDELMKHNELYYNISLALFKYLINHQKLRIAEEAVSRFKEHLDGAKARYETGLINEIGLRQAEQNYTHMRSKYSVALVQLQSARENLTKYSEAIDLKQLEKFKFSFERLNLDDYISKIVETLPVRKAKADLRYARAQSIANCVSAITPTISISSNDIFARSEKSKKIQVQGAGPNAGQAFEMADPNYPASKGGIRVGLRFDISPVNLMTFAIAVEQNQLAALKLVQAERESRIGLQSNLAEFNLQKKTVEMYRNAADLRRVVADLLRKRDIKDPEKHYSDLLKADSEVAKAYEDLQSQIMYLIEAALKAMQVAGIFIPENPDAVASSIASASKKSMKELNDASDRILAGKKVEKNAKEEQKVSKTSKMEAPKNVEKPKNVRPAVNSNNKVANNNNSAKNKNNIKTRKLSKIKE